MNDPILMDEPEDEPFVADDPDKPFTKDEEIAKLIKQKERLCASRDALVFQLRDQRMLNDVHKLILEERLGGPLVRFPLWKRIWRAIRPIREQLRPEAYE